MPGNVITREDWSELMDPGIYEIFDTAYDSAVSKSMIPEIFSVETSEKKSEDLLESGDVDNFEPFSGSVPYSGMQQGYKKTLTHVTYARGLAFELELVEDDQYDQINSKTKMLALAAARRKEADAASFFNNANTTVNTCGDALALASLVHASNVGGATQSNKGTTALSPVTVEANRRAMALYKSNKDNLLNISGTHLLVPIQLQEVAYEIVYSKGKVDSAQNNVNFMYQQLQIIPWKYLTSTTNWFMIDLELAKTYLKWFNRKDVQFYRDSEFDTFQAKYAGRMRYSYGCNEWRWVYANIV